jgi:hypothetical protein
MVFLAAVKSKEHGGVCYPQALGRLLTETAMQIASLDYS